MANIRVMPTVPSIPSLPSRFHEPAGLRWGRFPARSGAQLRWCMLPGAPTGADCVLVGGFSECAEKYFETLGDLAAQGHTLWFLEWSGQGTSARHRKRPGRPRAREYDQDAADLAAFAETTVGSSRPRIVIGHSMGAAIALLAMRAQPGLFAAAVLCAPMLALDTGRLPRRLVHGVAAAATALRLGHAIVPGTRIRPAGHPTRPAPSKTSGDAVRAQVQGSWFAERPQLRIDGVTFAWLLGTLDLCRRFDDGRLLADIAVPMLIGSAGIDSVVDIAAHRRAVAIVPQCRHVIFPDARHDLFMESDSIRARWLDEIERFLHGVRR